jgi:micrococcal nuclease
MSARIVRFRRSRSNLLRTALLCGVLLVAPTAAYLLTGEVTSEAGAAPRAEAASIGAAVHAGEIRITDGDTFRIREERIRIANIDTPEMPGRARCADEEVLALKARTRLGELLAAGPVTIEREGVDRYGRTLALVRVSGVDVGEQLIAEGAAQRWMGRKATWC